jgi:tetratricopeptide (TPR) repeat protein
MNTNDQSNGDPLNDAFKSADFGDKVWLFFSQHVRLLASLAIVILTFFGIAAIVTVRNNMARRQRQSAYLEILQTGARETFAQRYASERLGGAVYLELGDEAYQKREYQRAADYYRRAADGLGKSIFGGRATLGEGIALIKSGLQPQGEGVLARVVEEKTYPPSIRGNALYLLANSNRERKDVGKAKSLLQQLANSHFTDQWRAEAGALLREIELW